MNVIIPFIALIFAALRKTKSISNIAHNFSRVPNLIDRLKWQKRKRIKEYNQTKSVFHVRWDTTV